ncbi:unnamed protein product [Phyllotreta striolata]|uniref:Uncharacterized protein n=1 Tax=Phyllotreta striolata TaxID=444603 RepID=A0A9N9TYX9_PHYSR|nr:unnamed protein product [Phyllotreta striolata]
MDNGNAEVERFDSSKTTTARNHYGIPENYNPADHPEVKFRNHSNVDRSEAQRKRRSKNRLSNRRSTGYVNADVLEAAMKMGPDGEGTPDDNK